MEKKSPPTILPLFPGEKTTEPQDGVVLDEEGAVHVEENNIFPGIKAFPDGAHKIFPTPAPLSDATNIDGKQV